jgi:hypothetical protein
VVAGTPPGSGRRSARELTGPLFAVEVMLWAEETSRRLTTPPDSDLDITRFQTVGTVAI